MDTNRIIFEYGKAQLHIIMLQEQLQIQNAKILELTKKPTESETAEPGTDRVSESDTVKPEVKRRGRPKVVAETAVEASVDCGAAL